MGVRDLLFTPFYLLLISVGAFFLRPYFTNRQTRRYFLPALYLKIFGAVMVGFIFEFYYGYGGDTFNYYFKPGVIIANSFFESPVAWFRLVFGPTVYHPDTYQYASRIFTFGDAPTYFIARIVGFFGVVCGGSYYSIAIFFAVLSFSGVWALFNAFCTLYPALVKQLAVACLFIPSLWFWGSGILKDPITLSALGWIVYGVFGVVFQRRYSISMVLIFIVSFYILYTIKIYILMCLIPGIMVMVGFASMKGIDNWALKLLIVPFIVIIVVFGGFFSVQEVSEDNQRYSLDAIAYTAEETAKWLEYVGEQQAGSVYTFGDYDFSTGGMIRKAPLAVFTGLFRPVIWEVRNPVMLLSALESLFMIFLLIRAVWKIGLSRFFSQIFSNPVVGFCMVFSLAFAFAIGISTYNFGSLVRYRIPLIPFFIIGLYLISDGQNFRKRTDRRA